MHRPAPDRRFSPSQRIAAVQSPMIPIVTDMVRANPGTISLGQGVVAYGPPPRAIERLADFLAQPDPHKYQACQGIPQLVELVERKLAEENGVHIGDDRAVIVTAGGNMGFVNAVLAIVDPGDEVILLAPYYFNHEMAVMIAGARPVIVPTDDRYQPRLDALEAAITPRTRAIVTVSPNNPTGAVFSEEDLRAINALCGQRGLYHISDEAYEYFTWDEARHFAPAAIADSQAHTIGLYSLSKAYGFASWRIGYMVVPRGLFEPVRKIQDTNLICPPVVSQWAAVGALEAGAAYCRGKLPEIGRVRRIVLDTLAEAADVCRVPSAQGAFYVLIHVLAELDALAVVERLVREFQVAAMPGGTFGVTNRCALRISYGSLNCENAAEGIGRLVRGLRAIVKG